MFQKRGNKIISYKNMVTNQRTPSLDNWDQVFLNRSVNTRVSYTFVSQLKIIKAKTKSVTKKAKVTKNPIRKPFLLLKGDVKH